jgi:hypothetical protein
VEEQTPAPSPPVEKKKEEGWMEWENRIQKEYGAINTGKAVTWSGYGVWGCLKVLNGKKRCV